MKVALTVIMLATAQLTPPVSFFETIQDCMEEKERIEYSFIVTVFRGLERMTIDMAKGKYKVVCSIVK